MALLLQHLVMPVIAAAALTVPSPVGLLAQIPPVEPKFDVVSVKPCSPGPTPDASAGRGGSGDSRTARFHLPCQTVKNLILQAYYAFSDGRRHPPPFPPIEGGPGWIDSARYVIDATTDRTVTHAAMNGPMLQKLLEDRFQLKLRRDMRETAGYALTVAKGGPKLQPYHEGDCVDIGLVNPLTGPPPQVARGERPAICGTSRTRKPDAQATVWDVPGTTLAYFTKTFLAIALWDRPVVDKTGIEGLFDIHLEFTPDETSGAPGAPKPAAPDSAMVPGPSLYTALEQQLGLKLEPVKAPREFLVIESIERPSAN